MKIAILIAQIYSAGIFASGLFSILKLGKMSGMPDDAATFITDAEHPAVS